jgi:hypothetical protein
MNSFTFIEGEVSWTERMLIQLVEDWSGKKEIAKRYQRVVDDQTSGKSFWQVEDQPYNSPCLLSWTK